ncbi:hypothetical protein RIF29_01969 [Crotalaria pallida]|uniref:Uncharacterized protein n=1 Tax=Crotalaria pallida TaxID=3830 RepID=A0AAN9IZ78_CROPI
MCDFPNKHFNEKGINTSENNFSLKVDPLKTSLEYSKGDSSNSHNVPVKDNIVKCLPKKHLSSKLQFCLCSGKAKTSKHLQL